MRDVIRISRIVQGKNPREYFDPQEMTELEASIREFGVLEPILVRPIPDSEDFEIVAGERRWRAAKNIFGDDYDMPVCILEVNDDEAEAIALVENFHRADVSVAEEARTAQRQLYRKHGDKDDTAKHLGWSVALLERRLALLACTPTVLKALTERQILVGHAELLAGVPADRQDKVLAGVMANKVPVHVLKKQLGQFARRLSEAIFDTAQCAACPHNSARQASLFDESLGEGYCQHPTHFDELTLQVVEAKAAGLADEYRVVKIVKISDGFIPLPLTADGELGVGAAQFTACQGCQSFGCSISALPGSYGELTGPLCFDAACNSQKVAAQRRAEREASQNKAAPSTSGKSATTKKPDAGVQAKPSHQTPPRLLQYRVGAWRKWVANALMAQPERNGRVLVALCLAGHSADVRANHYADALARLTGHKPAAKGFTAALEHADGLDATLLAHAGEAVAACAALAVDEATLERLLDYLEIDEAQHFQIDKAFLELFTMNELEALATEVGLKKAMGERFKSAREGKKDAFIKALLSVKGFAYQGAVPQFMRYPRKPVCQAVATDTAGDAEGASGSDTLTQSEPEALLAAA